MEAIPTGVDLFDAGAAPFYRRKPYLAFGASGTGKSTLGLQFAMAGLERGEKVLYVCREKAQDLIQRAEGLGLSLVEHLDDDRLTPFPERPGSADVVLPQPALTLVHSE